MIYKNPVIPGFHPDPSVCRLGKDHYLVTSSFEYFPGVPLFHSKDLIHWRQIGHCLTRKSQLPLEKVRSSGGIFAPTIRHYGGLFYMVTTNITGGGNFYVYTDDPEGDWSEPVPVDQKGIDPSLFFDDNGKVYLTSTDDDRIVQSRIDIKTGKLLTKPVEIWPGTGGSYPEGPHLYKINGLYYLMIAEGGTEYGHMETIARSDSPWGPYESYPDNPILRHRSTNDPIQAADRADLIEAHDGSWWLVFLGVRPNGHPYCHHLGRETFLAPVKWSEDGWPIVGKNGKAMLETDADCLDIHKWDDAPARDDFDGGGWGLEWNFLRNPRDEHYSTSERPGWLRLSGSEVSLNDTDSPAFLGRRQEHFCLTATTLMDFSPSRENEEAGLAVYMNERHHYELAVKCIEGERLIVVSRRVGGLVTRMDYDKIDSGPVSLRITADRDTYHFSYSLDGREFKAAAQAQTRYLSTEVAGGWTGVYLGMYATGNGKKSTTPAFFDWFEYVAKD
ncbi:MAG: glycoside hydrolase family 43 protein [Candidatus Omnitrophica bacterium]|nr:glycoside hydrolase family 43 protein [Candidatus Omnitrophota bacterium]